MKILPLNNIKELSIKDGKVNITYNDGSKMIIPADDVKFLADYKNLNDSPEIDHCI